MGMAHVELVGTEAVYYVNGVEFCRRRLSTMTSGMIDIPGQVLLAAGMNGNDVRVEYERFDHRTREERRGTKRKKTYGPNRKWWNNR